MLFKIGSVHYLIIVNHKLLPNKRTISRIYGGLKVENNKEILMPFEIITSFIRL